MTLDEMKSEWRKGGDKGSYDEAALKQLVRARVRKHTGTAFQYFWAAFVLQIILYAMLSHVILKYWYEPTMTMPALLGIAAFIPFTTVMVRRFKAVALMNSSQGPMSTYVARRREFLESFYKFKRKYELMLIPLATLI